MHITIITTIVIYQQIDISKRIENTKNIIYIYLYFKSKFYNTKGKFETTLKLAAEL